VAGGQLGTKSTAFFVGVASLAGLFGIICAVFFALQARRVMFGTKDAVVYSGLATKASAMALGTELKSDQYFRDRGATVVLNRGIGSRTISFVVQDGVWNQEGVLSSFEELVRGAAPTVGELPVDVQLLDSKEDVEVTSTVGEICFGANNCVYYEGAATKDEAKSLGERLKAMGIFRGNAANVILTEHYGEGTTLALVVAGEAWTDPQKLNELETVVRDASPAVGGLPIEMHLLNPQMELKKDELIE
jgi:hypothetical protein